MFFCRLSIAVAQGSSSGLARREVKSELAKAPLQVMSLTAPGCKCLFISLSPSLQPFSVAREVKIRKKNILDMSVTHDKLTKATVNN